MEQTYDVIVPMTVKNLPVFQMNAEWLRKNLSCRRLLVIGAKELERPVNALGAEFLEEDTLVQGMTLECIRACMERRIGNGKRAGWYFQQFLKFGYAYCCEDEYYIVWDADTVPLHAISHMEEGHPVFTKKDEMEPAYFETLTRLFGGTVCRFGDFSFICENMIMHVEIMKEMLQAIMKQPGLSGDSFWERILSAVPDESLAESGFSEFETYGNYVMKYHPELYRLRTLRGLRKGAEFFGMNPSKEQLEWASGSYDTIAFEGWSYHHKLVGMLCRNPAVRKLLPFSVLVEAKAAIGRRK